MEHLSKPFVSVIVPVYNDAMRLKICLEALENQTYPKNLYEVIVVDNASNNSEEIKSVVTKFNQAVYTYESFPTAYGARNKGISLAKGEVIAFTDADCIPTVNWLENGVKNLLLAINCGLVGGKIQVFFKNPDCPTLVELYESITAFPQEELIKQQHFAATANVFTLKKVIDRVGTFNPNIKCTGDVEWGWRINSAGYQQIYADDTCVFHPARHSFTELHKRTIRLAGGMYDLILYNQHNYSFLQRNILYGIDLFKNLVPPINFIVSTFRNNQLNGLLPKAQVSLLLFLVRYITAIELVRLKLGSSSTRD